jgi:PAS domain S-box-containing protein
VSGEKDREIEGLRSQVAALEERLEVHERTALEQATRLEAALEESNQRKEAEEALRQSEERFSRIFRASPLPILLSAIADGKCLDANEACLHALGYARDEVIGRTEADLQLWFEPETHRQVARSLEGGRAVRDLEMGLRTKSGERRDVLAFFDLIDLANQRCVLFMFHDVTERLRLEEELRHSHKMEAIGRLAGGVAHDFNNILAVVTGFSELVLRNLDGGSPLRRNIEHIHSAAQRGSALTSQLLAFSRRQALQRTPLDLNGVVAGVGSMLRRLIDEPIELVSVLEPALWRVRASVGHMEQVIVNLAVNARDAIRDGGRITIQTANVELDDAYARTNPSVRPGRYVMLSVTDTGAGIAPDAKTRVFEPFFTTKAPGKGTGLGLSTVYGIVTECGGHVSFYSEPGVGTTFRVYLPCVEAGGAEANVPPQAEPSPRGEETILLVEDHEAVRGLVREILESHGYRVLPAKDGPEAVEIIGRYPGPIHLLLTDVIMPQMRGDDVAVRLLSARPTLKVLFMSGYPSDTLTQRGILEPSNAFLRKPFSVEDLARKVRSVLEETQGPP